MSSARQKQTPPDLTRAEALALAKARWGEGAWISYGVVLGYRVGRTWADDRSSTRRQTRGMSALSWRDACIAAGLLESEQ